MQAMFIDVDGTLSSPCYKVNGKFQIGMSDVQWADYCSKHGEDTYEWCRPVMQVKVILVRKSGTEPVLRVMVEAATHALCEENVASVIDAMQKSGHLIRVR